MSFWGNVDTSAVTGEIKDGMAPIADNTVVKAMIEDVAWNEYEHERKIKVTWMVMQPDNLLNRKVFQNLRVADFDESKRARALQMFAAIVKNSGREDILQSGVEPDAVALQGLVRTKPQYLKLGVWEMNGNSGNWVKAISSNEIAGGNSQAPAPQAQAGNAALDDNIPF